MDGIIGQGVASRTRAQGHPILQLYVLGVFGRYRRQAACIEPKEAIPVVGQYAAGRGGREAGAAKKRRTHLEVDDVDAVIREKVGSTLEDEGLIAFNVNFEQGNRVDAPLTHVCVE
jgi:hypothetical protein